MSGISLSPTRRELLAATAAAGAISLLPGTLLAAAGDQSIRPFTVSFPKEELTELRRRVAATRWPDRETVKDTSQGVQFDTMQKLAKYWSTDYDWSKAEAKLNAVPQFITEIDGLDIHFIHVRSKHENALPVIITHGWPGSIIEQMKVIGPLTDPTAHGGTAADAFHVVIPSLPGYGFSGKPTAPGWTPITIAQAWATLMQRLGYTKYVAQGGDWGNAVSEVMALQQPQGIARHPHQHGGHGSGQHLEGARLPRGAARRSRPPTNATPGTSWSTSTARGWATRSKCRTARRRSTRSRIRRSGSPPGCSITTSAATS